MCSGLQQVMGAFTWTRSGETSPQWCAMPSGQLKTLTGRYSDLRQVDPRTLNNVVCNIANAPGNNDQGLRAIQNNAGGCPP